MLPLSDGSQAVSLVPDCADLRQLAVAVLPIPRHGVLPVDPPRGDGGGDGPVLIGLGGGWGANTDRRFVGKLGIFLSFGVRPF